MLLQHPAPKSRAVRAVSCCALECERRNENAGIEGGAKHLALALFFSTAHPTHEFRYVLFADAFCLGVFRYLLGDSL